MSVSPGPWASGQQTRRPRIVEPLESFSPSDWEGSEPSDYDWIVDGCFLRGTVAMLSGDGGLGKSLVMQQLLTAAAIGKAWLGLDTERCNSYGFFCEDDKEELQRRQHRINEHYGCGYADLTPIRFAPRVGRENVLMEFDRRTDAPNAMPLFDQLRHECLEHEARIVVLDTLADVFAGNEIIRNQVRRFISALRKLAMEMRGVVILTAHPSNVGLATGTGVSGSTAWNNSVRSRLYLTRAKVVDGEDEDPNRRLLKTMKNNQGPFGGRYPLRWKGGVFLREDEGAVSNVVDKIEVDRDLIEAARQILDDGEFAAASKDAKNGLVNVARRRGCSKYNFASLAAAQDRLLAHGKLVKIELGPQSKRRVYIRPVDLLYPGETSGATA